MDRDTYHPFGGHDSHLRASYDNRSLLRAPAPDEGIEFDGEYFGGNKKRYAKINNDGEVEILHERGSSALATGYDVPRSKAWFLIIVATLYTLIVSGVVFGWSPMENKLRSEGVYEWKCQAGQPIPCPQQDEALNLVFTTASSLFGFSIWPSGMILDNLGPRITVLVGSVISLAGSIIFAFSSHEHDYFAVGYSLLGAGGPMIFLSFICIANLFPGSEGSIVTVLNVALDASCIVFSVLPYIHADLKTIMLCYGAVPLIILISAPFLWKGKSYQPQEIPKGDEDFTMPSKPKLDLSQLKLWRQMFSVEYIMFVLYLCVHLYQVNFYIGTVNIQAAAVMDKEQADIWAQIFSYVLPAGGVLSVPIVGFFIDRLGMKVSMVALTITATLFAVACLFAESKIVLGVAFVLIAFFRAFLFSAMTGFIFLIFGTNNFGTLWGMAMGLVAIVNLTNTPLTGYIARDLHNNFFWPNVVLGALSLISFVFPFHLIFVSPLCAPRNVAPVLVLTDPNGPNSRDHADSYGNGGVVLSSHRNEDFMSLYEKMDA